MQFCDYKFKKILSKTLNRMEKKFLMDIGDKGHEILICFLEFRMGLDYIYLWVGDIFALQMRS